MQAVKAHGLEGVIAKRLDSKYHPDRRSDDWLKLPLKPSQHFVIGAYRLDGKRLEIPLVDQLENTPGRDVALRRPRPSSGLGFYGVMNGLPGR